MIKNSHKEFLVDLGEVREIIESDCVANAASDVYRANKDLLDTTALDPFIEVIDLSELKLTGNPNTTTHLLYTPMVLANAGYHASAKIMDLKWQNNRHD